MVKSGASKYGGSKANAPHLKKHSKSGNCSMKKQCQIKGNDTLHEDEDEDKDGVFLREELAEKDRPVHVLLALQ